MTKRGTFCAVLIVFGVIFGPVLMATAIGLTWVLL